MFRVERLGRVFDPLRCSSGLTHGSNALALSVDGDTVEIIFNQRDCHNRSVVSRAWLDMAKFAVLDVESSILVPGPEHVGSEMGLSLGNVVTIEGRDLLSLMGWSKSARHPWVGSLCAVDLDSLDSIPCPPFITDIGSGPPAPLLSCSYPFIEVVSPGELRLLFGGTSSWSDDGSMRHSLYQLSGSTLSSIGFGIPQRVNFQDGFMRGFLVARPWLSLSGARELFFSAREKKNPNYSIYSGVFDGDAIRDLEITLSGSGKGWDSDMACYGSTFVCRGESFLLYSGNGYGVTGFGVASLN